MTHPLLSVPIAIVYDHLTTTYGGAELVLQVLLRLFPQADLFTTVFEKSQISWIENKRVHTSFLQKLGILKKYHQLWLPLHPLAIEQLDLSPYKIVISVTAGVAKGVLTHPNQLHVSYVLTPPRYLDTQNPERKHYLQSQGVLTIPGAQYISEPLFKYLSNWDRVASWRSDKMIAISKLVAERISKQYNRKVDRVLYPPFIPITPLADVRPNLPAFLLSFSRLISYKRVDLSIQSAVLSKKLLIVAGEGSDRSRLFRIHPEAQLIRKGSQSITSCIQQAILNKKLIIFVGHCTDSEKSFLFSHCSAVLMPGQEDFGLIGLEAAHFGKPIITNELSGIAEVLTTDYAVHIQEKSVKALHAAINTLDQKKFSPSRLKSLANNYAEQQFSQLFLNTLYQFWQQHSTISAGLLETV